MRQSTAVPDNASNPHHHGRAGGFDLIHSVDSIKVPGAPAVFAKFLLLSVSLLVISPAYPQQGPEISLDATALVDDIRQTRTVATDVESSLSEALQTVEQQTSQLKSAGCEPGNDTPECRSLKDSLRDDYLAVLDNLDNRLPALRTSVQQVVANIEVRMGRQAGSTASEIQEELIGNQDGSPGKRKPALQGVSGSRLSESLGRLQSMVSTSSGSGASFRTIQADLYLDMQESLTVIENLSADIQRTRLLAELQLGDIDVGEEEQRIAQEAQNYLFGEPQTQALPAPLLPDIPTKQDERSPLEL